jgi:hypothetical protein
MGTFVSRRSCVCAVVLAASSAACEARSASTPPAAVPVAPVSGGYLGGGCSVDTPHVVDRQTPDAPPRAPSPFAGALDGRTVLLLWTEGSIEQGFDLLARAVSTDGVAMGPDVTVSSNLVGRPLTTPSTERGLHIWFMEASDERIRHLATTVHCSP